MSHHHRRAAAVSAPDPYFSNTVLLLTGNGTNGGQNNTFLDDSSNNFTITRNGNTTQGSFSPFGWQWSNYFDGSGDYLSVANNTALQMSGDFTWEAWVFPISNPSGGNYKTFWAQRGSSGGVGGPAVVLDSSGNYLLFISNAGATAWAVPGFDTGLDVTLNQWQHIALVKSGTTVTLYKNGVAGTSTTHSTAVGTNGSLSIMAGAADGSQAVDGYMSNFRIVKGTALYTSNFTPSTAPLTAITNTQLLTCQSNRFIDNSSNAFAITRNGDVRVTNFSPFPAGEYAASVEGGSGYFDGTGDYLTFPGITLSGDFCCECWYYRTANSTNYSVIFGGSSNNGANNNQFTVTNTGGLTFVLSATAIINNAGTAFVNNTWNHLAYVRSGTNCAVFVNGVRQGTGTSNIATSVCSRIGDIAGLAGYQPIGNISNARIVSGSSVYDPTQTTLTVPANPLTAITNTQLLLNFTNGSIVDATGKNDLETVGNAQISTSVKKYGTGSMAFDGTGDYLILPASSDFAFGTGDFTIEFWLYMNATSGDKNIYDPRTTGNQVIPVLYAQNGAIIYFVSNANRIVGSTLSASTWYHIAVSRSGTSTKLFVDGTQSGSTYTDSNNYIAGRLAVGAYVPNTINAFNGYMDDLRVTKGIARYTANFTPPYRQLPTR